MTTIASIAITTAVLSWIFFSIIFTPLSICCIVWGFMNYSREDPEYYMLFAAILILVLRIPAALLLGSIV